MVRQPQPLLARVYPAGTFAGAALQARAARNMFQQPEHGTLASRIRVEPGQTRRVRLRSPGDYPVGSLYWFQPGAAERSGICRRRADLAQLLRDPMGRFRRDGAGRVPAVGRTGARHFRFSRFDVRLLLSRRNHRRGDEHAGDSAHRHGDPSRRRRALGLGGPAYPRGLLRGLLHAACLELSASALESVSPRWSARCAKPNSKASINCRPAA